ncbi:MAG: 2-amino-4-hydroxy-6-hydroxymethyldihydropteridine diphosphokinase [Proteobacteria bacterium]|nr:2-amino-4-hydroxy-6-hydroxymethyldihydropteridine diphosphokinase [Pseudomonadota bacterium]
MNTVILGVGSNLDAKANIERARGLISKKMTLTRESEFIETLAVDMPGEPDFLNGAFVVQTPLEVAELKSYLKGVEEELGRDPAHQENESRTIDLDIIVFNGKIVNDDFERYDFVRKSVLELAPELIEQTN